MKANIDFSKLDLTDISKIELNNDEDTCTVTLEPIAGGGGERVEYEEAFTFSRDMPSPRVKAAAREFAEAMLEWVRERGQTKRELPCLSCIGACCTNKEGVVRVTQADVERLRNSPAVVEYDIDFYSDESWTGYVGAVRRGPLPSHHFGGETEGCVFLGDRGCTVYEHRPQVCRDYSAWTCGDTYTPDRRKLHELKKGKHTLLVLP